MGRLLLLDLLYFSADRAAVQAQSALGLPPGSLYSLCKIFKHSPRTAFAVRGLLVFHGIRLSYRMA